MSEHSLKNWHIIYVRSRFEKKIFSELTERKIQCYLPLKYQVKQWHDRKKKVLLPVFPGYVFVCISRKEMLSVYEARGFVKFLCTNSVPDVISDQRMSYIMKVLEGEFEVFQDQFQTGDAVLIESGPLAGLEGTLIEDRKGSKFVLHLQELNRSVVIDAKLTYITRKMSLS